MTRTHEDAADAHGFELCRSDTGDGGWSLHRPGEFDPIISGPAKWDATTQDWDRPHSTDYAAAKSRVLLR